MKRVCWCVCVCWSVCVSERLVSARVHACVVDMQSKLLPLIVEMKCLLICTLRTPPSLNTQALFLLCCYGRRRDPHPEINVVSQRLDLGDKSSSFMMKSSLNVLNLETL